MSNPKVKFVSNNDGGDRLTNSPNEHVPHSYRVIVDGKHVGLVVKRNGKWGFHFKHREPADKFDIEIYDFQDPPLVVGRDFNAVKSAVKDFVRLPNETLADMGVIV